MLAEGKLVTNEMTPVCLLQTLGLCQFSTVVTKLQTLKCFSLIAAFPYADPQQTCVTLNKTLQLAMFCRRSVIFSRPAEAKIYHPITVRSVTLKLVERVQYHSTK